MVQETQTIRRQNHFMGLALWGLTSQNGQTHFKNLAVNATRFLKCVWLFWDVKYWRVKVYFEYFLLEEYKAFPLLTSNSWYD